MDGFSIHCLLLGLTRKRNRSSTIVPVASLLKFIVMDRLQQWARLILDHHRAFHLTYVYELRKC